MIERCAEPGCPELTRSGRCARHTLKRSGSSGYGSYRWRKFAKAQLRGAICEEPGCRKPATALHHRDGKGPFGPHAFELWNVERLCRRCHGKRHRQDRGGRDGIAALAPATSVTRAAVEKTLKKSEVRE